MVHEMRYDKQLLDGQYNPEPKWRNPSVLHASLTETLNFTPVQHTSPDAANEWLLYGNPVEHLVVAAYQFHPQHIMHIFTNNPARAPDGDIGTLVAQAQSTARLISESKLYPGWRTDATAALLDLFGGMAVGAAAGFPIGAGFVELASRLCGVHIPYTAAGIPAVLGASLLGIYRCERPENQRKNEAARYVIGNMPAHPATFLHGVPAVKLLKQIESRTLA